MSWCVVFLISYIYFMKSEIKLSVAFPHTTFSSHTTYRSPDTYLTTQRLNLIQIFEHFLKKTWIFKISFDHNRSNTAEEGVRLHMQIVQVCWNPRASRIHLHITFQWWFRTRLNFSISICDNIQKFHDFNIFVFQIYCLYRNPSTGNIATLFNASSGLPSRLTHMTLYIMLFTVLVFGNKMAAMSVCTSIYFMINDKYISYNWYYYNEICYVGDEPRCFVLQ